MQGIFLFCQRMTYWRQVDFLLAPFAYSIKQGERL